MLIKPERIKPLTSFTRCTRYQWNFQKQDPGLKLSLGQWYITQGGRLVKLVAQLQDGSYLILGQGCALAPLEWAEIDRRGFHGPRPRLTIPAPKSRRMDVLKKRMTMLPEWNNTIRTLAKLFPRAKWTPCLWMGRVALRIPNGPTDLASRGGQPYDE